MNKFKDFYKYCTISDTQADESTNKQTNMTEF